MSKGLVKGIALYGIGLSLLAFVVYRAWDDKAKDDGTVIPGLGTVLQSTPDWTLAPLLLLLPAAIVGIQIYRWYLLVNAAGLPFSRRNAFRLGLVGYFYNSFLPGSIGGDLVKAVFIARDHPTRMPVAVATVVIDRILGLFGLLWLSAAVGLTLWLNGDARIVGSEYLQKIVVVCGAGTAAIVLGWIALGLLSEHRQLRIEEWLHRMKPKKLGQTFAELWFAVRTFRSRSKIMYISVALSALAHLLMVLNFHFCVRFFPLSDVASLAEAAVIAPIGFIAQVFFPVPGGVGGAEAIFGFLYTLLDRPESTGVIGRLTLRIFDWAIGLAGYLMFLNMKKELSVPPASA